MSIWVLTKEYNDYDQHGEYFIHAWTHKPSRKELIEQGVPKTQLNCTDYPAHVLENKGRISVSLSMYQDAWFLLRELK